MNKKPTALLELSGAFKKNPNRRRGGEPKPDPILGPPPKRLRRDEAELWNEIVDQCAPRVLTKADRLSVEIAARCMARIVRGTARMAEYGVLRSCLASFGMTPLDRSRLKVEADTPQNRFASLKAESERLN